MADTDGIGKLPKTPGRIGHVRIASRNARVEHSARSTSGRMNGGESSRFVLDHTVTVAMGSRLPSELPFRVPAVRTSTACVISCGIEL